MKQLSKILFLLLLTGFIATQYISAQSWYDTDWSYRIPITITNSGSALTNYQVMVELDNSFSWSNMESDGADIRFTSSDGETEIDFWIEEFTYSTSAIIWVKVPTVSASPTNTTIYFYYGNSSANGASNGENTFDFFDGFDSGTSIDTDKWTCESGSVDNTSVADGLLTITATGDKTTVGNERFNGTSSFGTGYAGETRARHPEQGTGLLIIESGFISGAFEECIRLMDDNPSLTNWDRRTQTGGTADDPVPHMAQSADQSFHVFRMYRNTDNTVTFQIDENTGEDDDTNIPTGSLAPFLMSYSRNGNSNFIVDWTRVRKWDEDADLTTSLGTEKPLTRWEGTVDSDWADSDNWSTSQVPGSTSYVLITDQTNDPEISDRDPVKSCQELLIAGSASLTIQPGGALTVNGDLLNNGSLNLESDATGISSLIFDSYSGSGSTNFDIYFTGGSDPDDKWHYFAVPADMPKTAFTDVEAYNLLRWDDSRIIDDKMQGWQWHDGWDGTTIIPGDAWNNMEIKRGYNFYHASDVSISLAPVSSLLSSLGTINLQYNGDGLNLIGNSLTCSINWDDVSVSSKMRNAIYFTKNNELVAYVAQVGVPGGTSAIIPPLHGFFVKALTTRQSINFTGAKTHSTVNRYKSSSIIPLIRFNLLENDETVSETVIRFDYKATDDVDNKFDAPAIFSESINKNQIYSELNGEKYIINGINFPNPSKSVPLSIIIKDAGNYKIKRSQLQGLDNYNLVLTDTYENTTINIEELESYSFSSDAGIISDRFFFTISSIATGFDDTFDLTKDFNIFTYANRLNIQILNENWDESDNTISIFDLTGRLVDKHNNISLIYKETSTIPFNEPKGIYIVEITNNRNRSVQKISHR